MHVNNVALSTQVIRAGLDTGLRTVCSWMSDTWCRVVWYTETASSIFMMEEEFFSPVSIAKHYCTWKNSEYKRHWKYWNLANECYFGTKAGKIGELFTHTKWYKKKDATIMLWTVTIGGFKYVRNELTFLQAACITTFTVDRPLTPSCTSSIQSTPLSTVYIIQYTDVRRVLSQF
jgi:hypothetical protein